MKKLMIGIVLAIVLIGVGYLVVGRGMQARATTGEQAVPTSAPVVADRRVSAEAKVVPARVARLSLPTGGIVAEVLVAEGEQVAPGQTLVRLESARQAAAVAQAQAQLQRAQAALAELKAGSREEERQSAQAALDAAQARLERVRNGPLPAEVAAAKAVLAEAQAAQRKTLEGSDEQQIIAAQAEALNAAAAVRQAQAAYDRVAGDTNIGLRPESLQLEHATNAYNAAQARLPLLQKGAGPADFAAARARVQRAQAQLDLLAAVNPADVAAAEAEVRRAQAQLDLLAAAPRPEAIAAAEAEVAATLAALAQARIALAETELHAPFAGTVAALDARVGEHVGSGSPMAQLADLATLQVETDDLTELNVVRVREGASATLTFDALPGLSTTGKVVRVKPLGENKQGDITYTVVIQPDRLDERLRWNMTAAVTIEPW
jgi:multidrug efflux pump subunit AcrA (membrane-fusion protein)